MEITNVTFDNINVTGQAYVGGVLGRSGYGDLLIENVTVTGEVTSDISSNNYGNVGGVAGNFYGSDMRHITTNVSVSVAFGSSNDNEYGGVVGGLSANLWYVNASGSVTFDEGRDIGGVVGKNNGDMRYISSTVDVDGNKNIGGVVGINIGSLYEAYAAGNVTGGTNVGGAIGSNDNDGTQFHTYWDTEESGQNTSPGTATGLNSTQMTGDAAIDNMDFSWEDEWSTEDSGYPTPDGEGTQVSSGGGAPYLDVTIGDIDETPVAGTNVTGEVLVANMGGEEATQTIEFRVEGETVNSSEVTIPGSTTEVVTLSWTTEATGDFNTSFHSQDDSDNTTVSVVEEEDSTIISSGGDDDTLFDAIPGPDDPIFGFPVVLLLGVAGVAVGAGVYQSRD